MDIVIKTGFEKISHAINFQNQTGSKGKNLATACHVRDVEEHRRLGISYLIKANVVRQMSVTETPYAVKLEIDSKRVVTTVHCTCVYNRSEKCKHVAALIHYINNYESLSKTSFQQTWGMPTARQFVKEKYSKGCYFAEMFPSPKKADVEPAPIDIFKLQTSSALKRILLVNSKSQEESQERIKRAALLVQTQLSEEKKSCAKFARIILQLCEQKSIYKVGLCLQEEVKDFYEKYVVLSAKDAIVELCCDTLNQADNEKWYAARRVRVSASKNVHSIKTRKRKTIESLVEDMFYPKKVDSPSVSYGKKHEKDARKQYEVLYNVNVQRFGLVVSEQQPWLCASPDGAVIKDSLIQKLVEFKCPYSCVKLPIVDYENKKCNVNYLQVNEHNKVELKESSIYYTQCQVQMYVTGTSVCDLFVWSPIENGSCCIQVMRDEKFLSNVIPISEKFYCQYYLPHLYRKMIVEPNKLCEVRQQASNQNELNNTQRTFNGINIANNI